MSRHMETLPGAGASWHQSGIQAVHSWRLSCRKKGLHPFAPWLFPSFTHSLSQSLGKQLSTCDVLGPVLDFGDTDEDWTRQDPEVTRLDHFKRH